MLDPCRQLEPRGLQRDLSHAGARRAHRCRRRSPRRCAAIRCWCRSCTPTTRPACCEDVGALAAVCRERGVPLHSDCAQAAGKVALDVHALQLDFASLTAHKLYGPKGVGALYVRHGARALLQPLNFGGGQERGAAAGHPADAPDRRLRARLRAGRCRARRRERTPHRAARAAVGRAGRSARGAPERCAGGARAGDPQCLVRGRGGREPGRRPCRPCALDRRGLQLRFARSVLRAARPGTRYPAGAGSLRFSLGRFTTAAESTARSPA